jgi:hypothetical protein
MGGERIPPFGRNDNELECVLLRATLLGFQRRLKSRANRKKLVPRCKKTAKITQKSEKNSFLQDLCNPKLRTRN